jgi:hypothetical protein
MSITVTEPLQEPKKDEIAQGFRKVGNVIGTVIGVIIALFIGMFESLGKSVGENASKKKKR